MMTAAEHNPTRIAAAVSRVEEFFYRHGRWTRRAWLVVMTPPAVVGLALVGALIFAADGVEMAVEEWRKP